MKFAAKKFILPLLALCFSLALSACDLGSDSVHIHTFGAWEESAPTCTEEGMRERVCDTCGQSQTEPIPPLGHAWQPFETSPTCTESGRSGLVCPACGLEKEVTERAALGHSVEKTVLQKATCTQKGLLQIKCTVCGETSTEDIPTSPHEWSEVSVLEAADCTKAGLRCAVCETCGLREEEQVIPPLGHDWEVLNSTPPTCTEAGSSHERCRRCKTEQTVSLAAEGHEAGETQILKTPTCTEEGLEAILCKKCGAHITETKLGKTEHSYGIWKTEEEPTCTEAGSKVRNCGSCGAEDREEIPALGHDYATAFTVDLEPTPTEYGSMSRHCQRSGCSSRTEVTPIDPVKDETTYQISLRRSTGERLPAASAIKISLCGETGESVWEGSGTDAEVTLKSGTYSVRVSGLPLGYALDGEYTVTAAQPSIEIKVPAHMIMDDAPAGMDPYEIGSVLYDMTVDCIGLTADEDETVSLAELFSRYKAVVLNLYFNSCPVCVNEMPAFVEAYHKMSPNGVEYGSEVACAMLSNFELRESIRAFKQCTNVALKGYPACTDIPMIMLCNGYLTRYFCGYPSGSNKGLSGGFFPTTILIDCEGVIISAHTGQLSVSGFTSLMDEGLRRYNLIHPSAPAESNVRRLSSNEALLPSKELLTPSLGRTRQ